MGTVPAYADEGDSAAADSIAATVNAVAPPIDGTDRVDVNANGATFTAAGDSLQMSVPDKATGSVTLDPTGEGDTRSSFTVGLPVGSSATNAAVASDDTVTYSGALHDTDVAVQAFDAGVRVQTVLNRPDSPTHFTYPVSVPAGGHITSTDDGSVLVFDADGSLAGGFTAPWAKDANGADVATHYEVGTNSVTQVVEPTADAAYPIVADPWLWKDLIANATWVYHTGDGWTLQVAPTGWARIFAGSYDVGVADWNELYSKYRSHGLNTNLQGMKDQLICHQLIVAIRAPHKATWNLDEWRPNVGFLQTVNSSCNPGGSRWFD